MEGKSLPAVVVLILLASAAHAQWPVQWPSDPSLFLEPNRFSIAKALDSRSLWLTAGFGKDVVRITTRQEFENSEQIGIGLEGLIWSRLRALPEFRFPVETADYFFGLQATKLSVHSGWRFRLSHISSHVVDGADSSVVGGSSSRFSREFIELDRQQFFWEDRLRLSLGVRYLFHQVQAIEPSIAFPAALTFQIADFGSISGLARSPARWPASFEAFVSTGESASWPSYAAGLRYTHALIDISRSDLELLYQWGAPWAGTEAVKREGSLTVQLSLREF